MDYNTYLIDLGPIPENLYADLIAFVESNIPVTKSAYFTIGEEQGYLSARTNTDSSTKDQRFRGTVPETLYRILEGFDITRKALLGFEIARLLKDKTFQEHTDLCNINNNGVNVTRFHNLHIPISGEAEYLFRRDKRLDFDRLRMTKGHAYLLNNYVWHGVVNGKNLDRLNVICQVNDPEWLYKEHVYKKYSIAKGY